MDPATGAARDVAVVATAGANLARMREFQHIVDPARLRTNDVAAVLRLYGVEACRAALVREMAAVFAAHGIAVDARHLGLVADAMTRAGAYHPFSRFARAAHPAPLANMSFETATAFLRDAVLARDSDALAAPSSRIATGRLAAVGTGCFDVLAPADVPVHAADVP